MVSNKPAPINYAALDRFRRKGASHWWQFIEQHLYIQTKMGNLEPFGQAADEHGNRGLNSTQRKVFAKINEYKAKNDPMKLLLLKGRQRGISTALCGFTFEECYTNDNRNAFVVAHRKDVTESLLEKHKIFQFKLPDAARMPTSKSNELLIQWEHNLSRIQLATAKEVASGHGRTLHIVHLSEFSRYPNAEELIKGMLRAVPKSGISFVAAESTALGMDNYMYDLWINAMAGKTLWEPMFLRWQDDEDTSKFFATQRLLDEYLDEAFQRFPTLRDRMEHYGLTGPQMAWYYEQLMDMEGDLDYCAQEFPCDWQEAFRATGNPYFPAELIEEYALLTKPGLLYDPAIPFSIKRSLDKNNKAPDLRRNRDTYLEIFEQPNDKSRYLISADGAEGTDGRDKSSAFVFDMDTLNLVAEIHGTIEPEPFINMICSLGKIYNKAKICVERNGIGIALVSALKSSGYNNYFYNRKIKDNVWTTTPEIGWDTNRFTKPYMLTKAKEYFRKKRKDKKFLPSMELVNEMRTFIEDENKAKAKKHKHDDRVMAWAIGLTACLLERGHVRTGFTEEKSSIILPSKAPSIDELASMIDDDNWTGQSYYDFYGGR